MQSFDLKYKPKYLFASEFSKLHENFAGIDPHINFDKNKTRFRTYNLYQLSTELVRKFEYNGTILMAGINFGTAALILSHALKTQSKKLKFVFIDPFDGRKNNNVNLNPKIFIEKLPKINYNLVLGTIPENIPELNNCFLVHLNTTNIEAELQSIPILMNELMPGGALVWDIYGWLDDLDRIKADNALASFDILKLNLPTRQLIVIKN